MIREKGKHEAPYLSWKSPEIAVDHEYNGNMCSGFGGELICRAITDHGRCGLPPEKHRKPRHRKDD